MSRWLTDLRDVAVDFAHRFLFSVLILGVAVGLAALCFWLGWTWGGVVLLILGWLAFQLAMSESVTHGAAANRQERRQIREQLEEDTRDNPTLR
ncbi:MAG: hypothetical protein AAF628_09310 [Planctomycetota bacterium]